MSIKQLLCAFIAFLSIVSAGVAQQPAAPARQAESSSASTVAAPDPQPGSIGGTVTDTNGDIIPGAQVTLEGPAARDHETAVASDDGSFAFRNLRPGVPYHVLVTATGFVNWTSPVVVVNAGQYQFLTGCNLEVAAGATSVTVTASSVQIATEQVRVEEQQRVLGFVPNFYVVYDHNPAPLTAKLKFELALKAEIDPVTFLGEAFVAGLDQAGTTPNYGEGAAGYGQRFGALYTDGFTDIMFGGAVLPALLHQDPRYFYQGEGTTKSRVLHALASPFICRSDSGHWEPNYSSVGGDMISGAISNVYYPQSNRGPGLVFENALISSGGRMANGLVQEFLLRRLTPSARNPSN